jgi:hypothetical protein|nr:MAG TPA: tail component [Caudoviricetes sp.]
MPTLKAIKDTLEQYTGLPVAYHHYEDAHAFPYIVYEETDHTNVFADGQVYVEMVSVQLDLYTKTKSPRLERKVKDALSALDLAWTSRETNVQEENCTAVSFFFDTITD